MAKKKLEWTKIDFSTSDPQLSKLREAELKAQEKLNDHIVSLVIANIKHDGKPVTPQMVRVGRNFGQVSFAIDADAKGTTAGPTMGLKATK